MNMKSAIVIAAIMLASLVLAQTAPVLSNDRTVVHKQFSSMEHVKDGSGWNEESPRIFIHGFSAPVEGPGLPATMRTSGYLVSRAAETEDGGVLVDEIWRRPMISRSNKITADPKYYTHHSVGARWVSESNTLLLGYILSNPDRTTVVVDRLIVDMTDPLDWMVHDVSVQARSVETALDGKVFSEFSIQLSATGQPLVKLVSGESSREIEFDAMTTLSVEMRSSTSEYKILDMVENLADSVAEDISKGK